MSAVVHGWFSVTDCWSLNSFKIESHASCRGVFFSPSEIKSTKRDFLVSKITLIPETCEYLLPAADGFQLSKSGNLLPAPDVFQIPYQWKSHPGCSIFHRNLTTFVNSNQKCIKMHFCLHGKFWSAVLIASEKLAWAMHKLSHCALL